MYLLRPTFFWPVLAGRNFHPRVRARLDVDYTVHIYVLANKFEDVVHVK
jgi:hypothetical protein